MFYFRLMGGLGNQMFQYAAGKALSIKRGIPIKVDFDCPYPHIKYEYSLGIFKLHAEFATPRELRRCKPKRRLAKRLYLLLGKNPECLLLRERRDFHFQSDLFLAPDGSYISGFWQSEKYFNDIADIIRNDFSFRSPPDGENQKLCTQMRNRESVSLHIRRGDYVRVESANKVHGVCSPSYYKNSVAYILNRMPNAVFYIFSDDMQWVKANFQLAAPTIFVDINSSHNAYEDMRLMSHCKHHIIANSSFSWWGAWLNVNPDKIVIAPAKWMNDPKAIVKDLLPDSWIRL